LKSDEEAERFVAEADLTEYDFSEMKPFRFEIEKKEARVNMRLPTSLLEAVKSRARDRGVPYQRLIREAIEQSIAEPRKKAS
jgi:predicted DNA binding CopG/RHH family protein